MIRKEDPRGVLYHSQRENKKRRYAKFFLEPGHLLIPGEATIISTVVASSVAVTLYHSEKKLGGMCHYFRPAPMDNQTPTVAFGMVALRVLMREILEIGGDISGLKASIYGGACPAWANCQQTQKVMENLDVAINILAQNNIFIIEKDVGGNRGRKLSYFTDTNEIEIKKTKDVRQSDWFLAISGETE